MYTILLNKDKQLIATRRDRILEKSSLVDKIRFLVPTVIGDNEMCDFTDVYVEYLSPISKTFYAEKLICSDEMYDDTHYQYIVPIDTHLTNESGDIKVQLSFYKVDMNTDGNPDGFVLKTTGCNITIIPIDKWQQFIPDKSLLSLDQRILKQIAVEESIKARQDQIERKQVEINATISNIIDDENISDHTTYSSKKLEEVFLDENEVDNIFDRKKTENDSIDQLFDGEGVSEELSQAKEISHEDIDNLFDNAIVDEELSHVKEISTDEIDKLFDKNYPRYGEVDDEF